MLLTDDAAVASPQTFKSRSLSPPQKFSCFVFNFCSGGSEFPTILILNSELFFNLVLSCIPSRLTETSWKLIALKQGFLSSKERKPDPARAGNYPTVPLQRKPTHRQLWASTNFSLHDVLRVRLRSSLFT